MNQWMLRKGVESSQRRKGGPKPAAKGRLVWKISIQNDERERGGFHECPRDLQS